MIHFRPAVGMTIFTVLAFGVLIWLGVWQLQRLEWKLELIETVTSRAAGPALSLKDVEGRSLIDLRYQKLELTGTFDHAEEVYQYWPTEDGLGFKVITPLHLAGGETVLVDRGFVPEELKDPASRPGGQVEGPQVLEGRIRLDGEGTFGVADQVPEDRVWTYRKARAMARQMGISDAPDFLVEELPVPETTGYPQPLAPQMSFTNNHLSYALTWFGLALSLISVYIAVHRSQGRLTFHKGK